MQYGSIENLKYKDATIQGDMFEYGTHFRTTWNRLNTVFQILVGEKGHVQTGFRFCQIEQIFLNLLFDSICLLMLSEIMFFRLITYKPSKPTLFLPPLPNRVCVFVIVVALAFHAPLKETYLQIQEQNKREIRHRTNVRLAQLQLEQDNRQGSAIDEQEQETKSLSPSPTVSETHCRSISALSTIRSLCLGISLWFVLFVLCLLLLRQLHLSFPHEAF
jgi:hypothetical protein